MKRLLFLLLLSLAMLSTPYCQNMPEFVQQRLDSLQHKAKTCLTKFRYGYSPYSPFDYMPSNQLKYSFSDEEINIIDSLGLILDIGMIYDDEMRNRIVQLMRNEYEAYELDTLMDQYIRSSVRSNIYETVRRCRFDTLAIFQATLDSFYMDLINKGKNDLLYKQMYNYEVFQLMRLDTTEVFKQTYNHIIARAREREREALLNEKNYNRTGIAELCGYISDKRFIPLLIEALDKPENFRRETVIEALARMRVEPYYSDYVKKRTLTMEQIKDDKWLDFSLEDFVYVLGTQESFLELSNYLLSNKPYSTIVIDYEDHPEHRHYPVSDNAFILIRGNIENEEVQKMLGNGYIEDRTPYLKPLYEWMQKNYGKYKIKRIW